MRTSSVSWVSSGKTVVATMTQVAGQSDEAFDAAFDAHVASMLRRYPKD